VELGGVTRFTCPGWLRQVLRNVTMVDSGFLEGCRYLLHDRDPRFDEREMRPVLDAVGIKPLRLPAHSPNLNAEAERFIRSVRQECLSRVVLFGEASLGARGSEVFSTSTGGRRDEFLDPTGARCLGMADYVGGPAATRAAPAAAAC
jgi:transposase InsO family protein